MSRRQTFSTLEAAEIRRLYDTGRYSMQTLAAQFNCSATTIWRVVNRTDTYEPGGREKAVQLLNDIEEMLVALSLTIEDTLEDLAGIKEDVQFGQRSTKESTMNKQQQQYIAEHLDPMDTAETWDSGEAFADTILENADGELPVTRDDLIDYWREAREREQANSSDTRTITTNVNQEFTVSGFEWCVDEDGDLMVILEDGSHVIDHVMEPAWSTWQDADTIPDFAVTITPEHVALAEELYAEVTGEG